MTVVVAGRVLAGQGAKSGAGERVEGFGEVVEGGGAAERAVEHSVALGGNKGVIAGRRGCGREGCHVELW